MRRVAVIGNSGSGKTTLARDLAARLDVPHIELDAIFHQPGWTPLATAEFRARVGGVVAGAGWVVDGNYSAVADLVCAAADTLVWLDLPRRVVFPRTVRRTVGRALRRTELWNGNTEPWTNLWSLNPQRSVIAWSVSKHAEYRRKYAVLPEDPALQHLNFVRLRTSAQARAWADGVVV